MRITVVACLVASAAACSSKPLPGPAAWNRHVSEPSDGAAASQRAACAFAKGALPAETQGKSHPNGGDIPIDHIIVMMMENRSFDHYFQKLPEHGWSDVEVAPPTFMNLDNSGQPVFPRRDSGLCFVDPAHGWDAVHFQINGGKMDGFFSTNDQDHSTPVMGSASLDMISGSRGLLYYEADDLPVAYWLADKFAIADHYFSSVPGPTWPNRMYLYGATSQGTIDNSFVMNNDNTIFDELEQRKITWTIYYHRTPGFGVFVDRFLYYYSGDGSLTGDHVKKIDDFYVDAAAGKLPEVVFVDPDIGHEGVGANDEHPPAMMQIGQALIGKVVDAVIQSPTWKSTAMFITYDEHGGLYDHVVPPSACVPDDFPVMFHGDTVKANFDQLGVRVPMLLVSPYAKQHYVGHQLYDHTSITRFIEARFVMPALTRRDANAEAPWDMFDFAHRHDGSPGSAPAAPIDQGKLNGCLAIFGIGGQ
jgi:phospholipase C